MVQLNNKVTALVMGMVILLASISLKAQSNTSDVPPQLMATIDSFTCQLNAISSKKIKDSYTVHSISADSITIQNKMDLLESEIPLVYNHHVNGFINLYGNKKSQLTSRIISLSKYYFPIFEKILDQEGLPQEFKYLAVVESALNPRALSWAGASGLWQFIHSTGKMYGLEINSFVDERRDIEQSTRAACEYFKNSYELYGDWLLVIASYNCGPGNVNKAIRRSGGHKNFWKIMPYLPKETRGYVPAFIGAMYVMNHYKDFGIEPNEMEVASFLSRVEVTDEIHFSQVANFCGLSEDTISFFNPAFQKNYVKSATVESPKYINLPYSAAMRFIEYRDSIYKAPLLAYDAKGNPYEYIWSTKKITYRTRGTESIYAIAKRYNVSANDIKSWNIIRGTKVSSGKRLTLYVTEKKRINDHAETAALTEEEEVENNGISDESYKNGIAYKPEIKRPESKPKEETIKTKMVQDQKVYQVRQGDTLYAISKEHGMTLQQLLELNKLSKSSVIKPGEKLIISN